MAISRKGNVGNEHAPASSPAVAHRRAKRTEWRMRGIEPYNKIIVVFPSSVLPSRCYGNPPSPEGEGLIGCVHRCHFERSREIPYNRNENKRIRYAAGRGRPALPTASPQIGHVVISSEVEKSPAVGTARYAPAPAHLPAGAPCRTRLTQTLACGGSPPSNPPR